MLSIALPWNTILALVIIIGYIIISKNIKWLPVLPLGLFILYFIAELTVYIIEPYSWSVNWVGHLKIFSAVILSWSFFRIIFWIIVETVIKIKGNRDIFPKITQDFIQFIIFVVLLFMVLRARSDINLTSLLTTSAIFTIVLGLAVQATLSNFFSGLILQAERPFEIGDWIEFGDMEGKVVGISWKSTQLLTRQHVLIYIPNSVLASSTFKNYSKPTRKKICQMFIGLEYDAPPNKVRKVITDVLNQFSRVLKRPRINVRLLEFGDFAITYEIRFWHKAYGFEPQLKADISRQLWYALRRNNIRIPFPIRDVFHGNEERKYKAEMAVALESEIEQILAQVNILEPLSSEERHILAQQTFIENYGKGEVIVEEGEPGNSMYIIRSGECEATKLDENNHIKLLSKMVSGDFFGEISLLTGEPRTATVKATQDISLIVVAKDAFASVINHNDLISEEIAQVVVERQQKKGIFLENFEDMAKESRKFIEKISNFFKLKS